MMYSLLAAQDDRLPVHVFSGEAAWLDAEVAALREHLREVGPRKWGLCEKRVSAVDGSPGRSESACSSYYRQNAFVEGADGAVEVKAKQRPSKARHPRRDRIARDPPHFFVAGRARPKSPAERAREARGGAPGAARVAPARRSIGESRAVQDVIR